MKNLIIEDEITNKRYHFVRFDVICKNDTFLQKKDETGAIEIVVATEDYPSEYGSFILQEITPQPTHCEICGGPNH